MSARFGDRFNGVVATPLNRRGFLTLTGGVGAAAVLAACGSKSSGGGSGGAASPVGASSEVGKQIAGFINPGANSGAGKTVKLGALLALTGAGSFYGLTSSRGAQLAVSHIKAAGGPTFDLQIKDHQSGNAQVGVQLVRQLGLDHVPACIMSYAAIDGAALPGIAQYKILSLDGSGGTAQVFDGKPYFWGTRSEGGKDFYGGLFSYFKKYKPDAKKVFFCAYDSGAALNKLNTDILNEVLPQYGMTLAGTLFHPGGTTDYSSILAQVESKSPDIILADEVGLDAGYFMKGYATSGLDAQVVGFEFTPDAAKIAGSAYDKYWFSGDYFDANAPTNPFGSLFVSEFRKAYNTAPDFYAADTYDDVFKFWQTVRDTLAGGGDITSGEALQNALVANPTFPSVYGGTSSTVGTETLDTTTHSVKRRELGLFKVTSSKPSVLAYFATGSTQLTDAVAP